VPYNLAHLAIRETVGQAPLGSRHKRVKKVHKYLKDTRLRLRPECDTKRVSASGLRRPRIPSFAPTMSNSKAHEQSAIAATPYPQTRIVGPLCTVQPNRAKREKDYIDLSDKSQRRNLLRYEAVFSWKPTAPLVTRAPSARQYIELRITPVQPRNQRNCKKP
jgi:hypothetical protein